MKILKSFINYILISKRNHVIMTMLCYKISMIVLPICFILNWILLSALSVEHKYPNFNRIMLFIEIGLFLRFIWLPIFYFFKRKRTRAFHLFLIPMIVMLTTSKVLGYYGIDSDGIFFLFHKEEYLHTIENSPSIATDGGSKLVKIKMKSVWFGCHRYLVYDESDEMSNQLGNFRGINYIYFTDKNGNESKYKADNVVAKKYAKHIYIVHLCANTGQ